MTPLLIAVALAVGWPLSNDAPPEVRAAHQDYLKGDWAAFSRDVRKGLESNDERVTKNLLELLDASFEALKGKPLPVDFALPKELLRLEVATKRRENVHTGKLLYQLEVGAEYLKGTLEQVRIERFPNGLMLDWRARLGEFDTFVSENGNDELWAAAECTPKPPPAGLYLLTVKLKGADEVKGWFALYDHGSSASPVMTAPAPAEKTDARPTFRWADFKSPELKGFERRWSSMLLFDPKWNVVWSHWPDDLEHREATVEKDLLPGHYEVVLRFQEQRHFGGLAVARASATAVPFEVSARPAK
jgi:hypothetical protein